MIIISGGQTGADQGALRGALDVGLLTGGWMPAKFRTEEGSRPDLAVQYGLREHHSPRYPPRTRMNVKISDATVWVGSIGSPGFLCTKRASKDYGKPWIENPSPAKLRDFVDAHKVLMLNVAGSSESRFPGAFELARSLVYETFKGRS